MNNWDYKLAIQGLRVGSKRYDSSHEKVDRTIGWAMTRQSLDGGGLTQSRDKRMLGVHLGVLDPLWPLYDGRNIIF